MARTCRLVRAGRSVDAQWRRDGDALVLSPMGAPSLVVRLGEVSGLAGDGFTVRLQLPDGEISLERLGGDGPTLLESLRRDWPVVRAEVLRLAGGVRTAEVFSGNLASSDVRGPFHGYFVGDRLIVAPEDGDIVVLFAADFASVSFEEEAYTLRATGWDGGQTVFTKLGGKSAAFAGALETVRETLSRQAADVFARLLPTLAAGPRTDLAGQWLPGRLLSFENLERIAPGFETSFFSSWLPTMLRAKTGRALMTGVATGDRYLGYAVSAEEKTLPAVWLLVLRDETASLELLSHGDYATYLFRWGKDVLALVQGLVRLPDFSREALYMPIEQMTDERGIYAIPARDLPLLRNLRSRFIGRKIHAPAD